LRPMWETVRWTKSAAQDDATTPARSTREDELVSDARWRAEPARRSSRAEKTNGWRDEKDTATRREREVSACEEAVIVRGAKSWEGDADGGREDARRDRKRAHSERRKTEKDPWRRRAWDGDRDLSAGASRTTGTVRAADDRQTRRRTEPGEDDADEESTWTESDVPTRTNGRERWKDGW
jgi:hypothetical protein